MAGQTPTGLSWECPRCGTANPAAVLYCRACGRTASVTAVPTVQLLDSSSAPAGWTSPPPPTDATAPRSSWPLIVVVALLLAGIVGVAGTMLVFQGQGSQIATDQAPPPVVDAGTLRAGWGAWVIATYENDPMTDEPMALAVLDGQGAQGERLSIGCAKGSNSVSVQWNQYLGIAASDIEVDVRVDGGAITDMQWEITGDEDATILHEEEAADFAASLYGTTTLALGTIAPDTEPISVRFDVTGIEEVVPLVREHCGW